MTTLNDALLSRGLQGDTPSGNFFSDSSGKIQRFSDRVFLGSAVAQDGAAVPAQRTWVGLEASGYLTYMDTRSTAENISPIGGVAYVGATRTSDGPVGLTNVSIAYSGLAKNDLLDAVEANRRGAWPLYAVAVRSADGAAGAIAGSAMNEFHAVNFGSVVDVNPHISRNSKSGVTYGLIIGVGAEYAESGLATNQISAAIHFSGGSGTNAKFRKGLNFSYNSLDGIASDGNSGLGEAICLPRFAQIAWAWSGDDSVRGFSIRSECNSLTGATKIVSTNSGLRFYDQFENTVFRLYPDTAIASGDGSNYILARNIKAATGNPYFQATGSDTNIGVDLVGQNRGQFNFYGHSKTRHVCRVADAGALTTSSVNRVTIFANDGTANPYLKSEGSGTNITLGLEGKGTGGVEIRDGAATKKIEVNTTGVGFFAVTPVAKPTLPAALSTGGAETNTNIATAINAIRTALINYGLAA